jgi:hypothetical protein
MEDGDHDGTGCVRGDHACPVRSRDGLHPLYAFLPARLTNRQTPSLTALLDLMTRLCLSIRDFSGALLQTTGMDARVPDGSLVPNTLNVALFQIMDRHIRSQPKTGSTQDHKLLSEATLAFMEGLLFNISDELADR